MQGEFELYSSAGEMIAGRRLVASRRDALELARVLAWLEESGVDPVEPERIMDGLDSRPRLMDLVEGWQLPTGSAGFLPSVQRKCTVAACSLERLHACLQSERINGQVLEQSSWLGMLRDTFVGAKTTVEGSWDMGGAHWLQHARGACIAYCGKAGVPLLVGGMGRWRARDGVGKDGFLLGWRMHASKLLKQIRADSAGYWRGSADGVLLDEFDAAELLPAMRMLVRARLALGDVTVIDEPVCKREELGTFVNLRAQACMATQLIVWQARIGATHVFTVDASFTAQKRKQEQGGDSEPKLCVGARAAVSCDGCVSGGIIDEPEGKDNYLGEIAAQLDALDRLDEHARVILVFDALSVMEALQRFRRLGARDRQNGHVPRWIETLSALCDRLEVVVMIWQSSHCGEPVNEWADIAADAVREAIEVPPAPVVRAPCGFASLTFETYRVATEEGADERFVDGSSRRWMLGCSSKWVVEQLSKCSEHTISFDPSVHLRVCKMGDTLELCRRAVLAERYQMGDTVARGGRWWLQASAGAACPFGCVDDRGERLTYTWQHVQFNCLHRPLVTSRMHWSAALDRVCTYVKDYKPTGKVRKGGEDTSGVHQRLYTQASSCCMRAKASFDTALLSRGQQVLMERTVPSAADKQLVGGLAFQINADGSKRSSDPHLLKRVDAAVLAGLRLQEEGRTLVRQHERHARDDALARRTCHNILAQWARILLHSSPSRRASLADVRMGRRNALLELQLARRSGGIQERHMVPRLRKVLQHAGFCIGMLKDSTSLGGGKGQHLRSRLFVQWICKRVLLAWLLWKRGERGRRYRASPLHWLVHAGVWSSEAPLTHPRPASEGFQMMEEAATQQRSVGMAAVPTNGELARGARHCLRQWWRAGGWFGLHEARTHEAWLVSLRAWQRQRAALRTFLASGSCSGRPPPNVGDKRILDLMPDVAGRHQTRLSKHRRLRQRKREREAVQRRDEQSNQVWDEDSTDRWPVQACLGVRVRGPHRCVEVLVRWEGDWSDSWERAANLSRDLEAAARAEAAWRFPALQRKLEARMDQSVGIRKRRVRALEAAREVRATGRTWRLRREGGLLSWSISAAHTAFAREWVDEPKRRCRVMVDSETESEEE